jgi:hypothetical protein
MIIGERRRAEASTYLKERWGLQYAPSTLANMAMAQKGTGPAYRLRGKFAVYAEADLDAWAQPRITGLKRKASEAGEADAA